MTPEQIAQQFRATLYTQVGAFFSNTLRGPGFCAVCTAPAGAPLCNRCDSHRQTYGTQLANLVLPLAYVRGWMQPRHQSEHHVWQYKHRTFPDPRCMQDLQLMVSAAAVLHGPCIARAMGRWWETVTFVPSATRRGTDHPVVELARRAADQTPGAARILLAPGPSIGGDRHTLMADRFVVPSESESLVVSRHILVVDDTWVSGAKAQSAALALRAAGAWGVTVLCVARWLSWNWSEQQQLIRSLNAPYDATRCPISSGTCPG